jgi:hypothetical protein
MVSIQKNDSALKPQWQIGRWIWQRCSATGTLLLFLIPTLLALTASHVLPQIPAHLRSDAFGYQESLSEMQVQFKNWTPFLEAIGAFHIEDTLWFRLLLAGLAFTLLISLADQLRDIHVHRERASWTRAGAAATYLGLLFLVIGLAANARWGWQQDNVHIPPNEPVSTGPGGKHHIQLVSIRTEPTETLEIEVDGSRPLSIRWGARGRRGGYRYEWVSKGGPFVQVQAQGANGESLTLYNYEPRPRPVKTLQFAFDPQAPEHEADRLFIVADTKVVGRLVWLNKNAVNGEKPRFYLWTFGEDRRAPLADQEFVAAEPAGSHDTLVAQIGDVTYVLDVTRYVIVQVAYQPGFWALWTGGGLLVAGVLTSLVPRRQTWLSHS